MPARDLLERQAVERDPGLRFVDKLMDKRTAPPPMDRSPLPTQPADLRISRNVPMLADSQPFAEPPALPKKPATISVGIARSTYRTREREEVLAAIQPFLDVVQRDVNVRADIVLYDTPEQAYYGLLDGKQQIVLTHIFDYLLVRSWFANNPDNGLVPLSWAQPANPRVTDLDRDAPGPPGAGIELVVAADSTFQKPADLKGARLALAANYLDSPAAFLTSLLVGFDPNAATPFFSQVTMRRYAKDAVIDVLKGKADVACVDQGTIGALLRFYGIGPRLRTLAVSPHYNFDVLYTSLNNLETHRTEIELTQRTLTTLPKDPEGQEVLFLFDIQEWHDYREGDFDVARTYFGDFTRFLDRTPADIKLLRDPKAPIDRKTYDRYGDE